MTLVSLNTPKKVKKPKPLEGFGFFKLVSQERFELPTDALEGRCSIQLSY